MAPTSRTGPAATATPQALASPQPSRSPRRLAHDHPVCRFEVPVEHFVSLPLPTRRCNRPGYACFAAPARRQPGQLLRVAPPDRWWAVGGTGSALLLYALVEAVPFGAEADSALQEIPPGAASVADSLAQLDTFDELVDAVADDFFAGRPGEAEVRRALDGLIRLQARGPLLGWHEALTPDFFAWLRKGPD